MRRGRPTANRSARRLSDEIKRIRQLRMSLIDDSRLDGSATAIALADLAKAIASLERVRDTLEALEAEAAA